MGTASSSDHRSQNNKIINRERGAVIFQHHHGKVIDLGIRSSLLIDDDIIDIRVIGVGCMPLGTGPFPSGYQGGKEFHQC